MSEACTLFDTCYEEQGDPRRSCRLPDGARSLRITTGGCRARVRLNIRLARPATAPPPSPRTADWDYVEMALGDNSCARGRRVMPASDWTTAYAQEMNATSRWPRASWTRSARRRAPRSLPQLATEVEGCASSLVDMTNMRCSPACGQRCRPSDRARATSLCASSIPPTSGPTSRARTRSLTPASPTTRIRSSRWCIRARWSDGRLVRGRRAADVGDAWVELLEGVRRPLRRHLHSDCESQLESQIVPAELSQVTRSSPPPSRAQQRALRQGVRRRHPRGGARVPSRGATRATRLRDRVEHMKTACEIGDAGDVAAVADVQVACDLSAPAKLQKMGCGSGQCSAGARSTSTSRLPTRRPTRRGRRVAQPRRVRRHRRRGTHPGRAPAGR